MTDLTERAADTHLMLKFLNTGPTINRDETKKTGVQFEFVKPSISRACIFWVMAPMIFS